MADITYFAAQSAAQATTNSFADIAETEVGIQPGQRCVAQFINTDGSNTATIQMLARFSSVDDQGAADVSDWQTIATTSAMTIAPGATLVVDCRDLAPDASYVKFQCKSTSSGNSADVLAFGTVAPADHWKTSLVRAFDPTA